VSIREERYKLAEYYDALGNVPSQWEMYDLEHDPLEKRNIAFHGHLRTEHQEEELRRLKERLAEVQRMRLQPLPNTPVITSAEQPRRGQYLQQNPPS
jgi:hypothetical protein